MGRIGTAASVLLALAAIAVISLTTPDPAPPPSPEASRSEFVGPVAAQAGQVVAAAQQVEVTPSGAASTAVAAAASTAATAGSTTTSASSTAPSATTAAALATTRQPGHLFEDEAGWECAAMGNKKCGGAAVVTTTPTTPAPTTPAPTTPAPTTPAPTTPPTGCHPNYGGCVPIATDVDCEGGGGDGPAYVTGPVPVIGDDVYELDRNGDGQACEEADGEPATPATAGAGTFGSGVYAVGTGAGQIAPGEYTSTGPTSGGAGTCYYARLRNNDGGVDAIITNNITQGPNILTVAATDAYVQISGCTFTRA